MLGNALQALTENVMGRQGTATLVNGEGPVMGFWERAQPSRIAIFMQETTSQQEPVLVTLPSAVLSAPCSLTVGSELTWSAAGWKAVVRALDLVDIQGVIVRVTAICEVMSE